MSRRGNCWDNAVAESFFSSLKKERIRKRVPLRRQMYSITSRSSTIELDVIAILAASALRLSRWPRYEAWMCHLYRGKSTWPYSGLFTLDFDDCFLLQCNKGHGNVSPDMPMQGLLGCSTFVNSLTNS